MVEQSLGGNYGSMMLNIKTHVQGMGKVLYAYFLAVALGWAAFPIIVIALSQYAQLYVVLSVYTFVVTLVFICILYMMMHGFGELDRKPYQWARYNMKGFACAAAAFALIVLAEIIMILLADQIYYCKIIPILRLRRLTITQN